MMTRLSVSEIAKCLMPVFCAVLAVCFLTACGDKKKEEADKVENAAAKKVSRENPDLELSFLQHHPVFTAGRKGQTVRLKFENRGLTPFTVIDWRMKDGDNFALFYAVCEPGESGTVPFNAWKQAWPLPDTPAPGRYSPVTLNPNNWLLLEVPMDFLKDYSMPEGKKNVTMAIYAELRIPSLKAKTRTGEITVCAAETKTKERKPDR